MAGPTGLEPATSGVTGLRSNQLSYDPASKNRRRSIPTFSGAATPSGNVASATVSKGGNGTADGSGPAPGPMSTTFRFGGAEGPRSSGPCW
jgi:hypothetical protein